MPTCFLCKETVYSVNSLLTHFNVKHYINSFTIFKCGEHGCIREWSSWNSLRKHLLGPNHNFPLWPTTTKHAHIQSNTEFIDKLIPYVDNHHKNTNICETFSKENINKDSLITLNEFKSLVRNQCDAFIAKLYNRSSIPRNHIQSIIDDSTLFLTNGYIPILKEKVLSQLNVLNSDNQTIQDIRSMFEVIENSFHHLRNEYQRMEYLKSCGNYIVPVEYCISKKRVPKKTGKFIVEHVK